MITFNKLGSYGRLGNQLFQIASTIGIARENNTDYAFNKWEYNKYFKYQLPITLQEYPLLSEQSFNYTKYTIGENNSNLHGYFQSEKYFYKYEDFIKKTFQFTYEFKDEILNKIDKNIFNKEVVAIHIRRGDYVNNENYYQLPITYYYKALRTFFNNKDYNVLIFSDDISYCKEHFSCVDNVYFSENNSDIEDLCLMTQCDHFILSNSTYSWWGAYLGKKDNSIIIHSGELFDNHFSEKNNSNDFYPITWIKYNDFKLNLQLLTFCIPILLDSSDRVNNLKLVLNYLKKYFHCEIKVYEEITNFPTETTIEKICKENNCTYKRTENTLFHRTKMLNDMFKDSTTKFVANWDCDVLISPIAIAEAYKKLLNGYVMVYPYNGNFIRVDKKHFSSILNKLDIGDLHNVTTKENVVSVGGAVFMNKYSYLQLGGENEHFISFGAEDTERITRITKLGWNVIRINANLYHINHWVGINSSVKNPYFLNNRDEFHKICQLNKDQLEEYIKTWQWKL